MKNKIDVAKVRGLLVQLIGTANDRLYLPEERIVPDFLLHIGGVDCITENSNGDCFALRWEDDGHEFYFDFSIEDLNDAEIGPSGYLVIGCDQQDAKFVIALQKIETFPFVLPE